MLTISLMANILAAYPSASSCLSMLESPPFKWTISMDSGDKCAAINTTAIKNASFGCLDLWCTTPVGSVRGLQIRQIFWGSNKGRCSNHLAGRKYLI